jgi:phospholipid transport system substrate-binding protein
MAPSWSSAQESPERAVIRLQDVLIEAMRQGGETDYAQSFARIAPVVDATVDLAGIARLVLGRHWRKLTADQQARFLESFRELSISTYVARFNDHHDEFFEIQMQESTGERVVVHSNLVRGDKPPIEFEYQVHDVAGTWRIVNIIVEGVSDLALKRAEYNAILTDGDFDSLLGTLDEQIARNREQRM